MRAFSIGLLSALFIAASGVGYALSAADQPAPTAPVHTDTTVYDSWTVTCQETGPGKTGKSCSAVLRAREQKSNKVVLLWIIAFSPEGKMMTDVRIPSGVLIQKGLELAIGEGKAHVIPFVSCDPQGCEAATPFDDAMIREGNGAAEAKVTVYAKNGQQVSFPLGIKGFDKAISALRKG
jgi:invasion protein IalB